MQRPLEPSTQLIFLQVAFLSPHLSPADFVVAPTSHVPRPVSIRVSLRSSLPLVQQAVQFSRIGVKTVTLASWRFFSTLWIFKFSPLCAFKCILPWSGSWLGRPLREPESRCCQLRPREIDSRAQIRTRSVLLNRNEKCANCQWQLLQMKLVQDLRLGERAIALNLNPNHQLHRIQRSIYSRCYFQRHQIQCYFYTFSSR